MTKSLWEVQILTNSEAEDAVGHLLSTLFGTGAGSYLDLKSGLLKVSAFVEFNPLRSAELRRGIWDGIARIRNCGIQMRPGLVSVKPVRRENWAESWKKHFKPIQIGTKLLVKPGWSRRRAKPGQAVVVLDPGLSFGTGQHPTTAFCLEQLAAARDGGKRQSFLDVGTGSGILAIAAAKLGYSPVHALDNDLESVRMARRNVALNRVTRRVRIARADITRLSQHPGRSFSVVCANLVAPLLLQEKRRLISRVKGGGVLVLAGILKTEFPLVQKAYSAAGFKLFASRCGGEWRSGSFRSQC